MTYECLLNGDLVLFCCEVEGTDLVARWVQINPAAHPTIAGTTQDLYPPKGLAPVMSVTVPPDLAPVHTDVSFPIVATVPLDS
jgi:hypothetical protein